MTEPVAGDARDGEGPGPAGDVRPRPTLIACRWTVNAHGFHRGDEILVDPTIEGIGELLNGLILVPLPAIEQSGGLSDSRSGT